MIKIRYNVFETNSSSVHSLIMTDEDTFKKLENGSLMIAGYEANCKDEFITYERAYEMLKQLYADPNERRRINEDYIIDNLEDCPRDIIEDIMDAKEIAYTLENYGGEEYEKFEEYYTSPSGDKIVAFGYFGRDG